MLALSTACSVSLEVPAGLSVTCATDAQCPEDARCNPLSGQCDFNVGNSAPSVAFRQLGPANGRAATSVTLGFDAIDFNAPPVGTDTVSFALQYSLDGNTWCDATVSGTPAAVQATTTATSITWEALADAQRLATSDPCSLAVAQLQTSPADGSVPVDVLAFSDTVRVRLVAVDSAAPPARSVTTSPVFAVGNDAPVLALVDDGATLRQASPFEYTLADSSLDQSRIEVQFRIEGPTPSDWFTASVRGSTEGVVADAPGTTISRLLVWNADAPLPLDVTTPGGIGRVNRTVTLRARAVESALGDVTTFGAWASLGAAVQNQTPPVVGGVEVVPVEPDFSSTLVFVSYEVVDAESDLVDVSVEFSVDGGTAWSAATPYPIVQHSGTLDIAGRSSSPDRQTFVWNVNDDFALPSNDVRVRVIAADDGGASAPAFGSLLQPVGSVGTASVTEFLYPIFATGTYLSNDTASREGTLMATGDVTGDGVDDTVVWAGGSLEFFPGTAAGGLGTRTNRAFNGSHSRAVTIVDVNHDGRGDVIARSDEDGMLLGLGSAAGPTYSAIPGTTGTLMAFLATGDFNGDTHIDVAVAQNQGVWIFLNNGAGALAAPVSLPVGDDLYSIAAGDFDGDGVDDLAYAVATGSGFGEIVKPTFLEVRVRYGSPTGSPPFRAGFEVVEVGLGINGDENSFTNAMLAAGDILGDARDELVFLDLQQLNLSRLRLFAREPLWRTVDTLVDNLPPMRRLHFRPGTPAQVAAGNPTTSVVFGWDAVLDKWTRLTSELIGANDIVVEDRNGDGQADLLVATKTQVNVRVRTDAHGSPAFPGTPSSSFIVPNKNKATVAGDFDGDGLVDVWALDAGNQSNHVIAKFRATAQRNVPRAALEVVGAPTFMIPDNTNLQTAVDYPSVGDVNGDGILDVVLSTLSTSYFLTLGTGLPSGFQSAVLVSAGGTGEAALGDFDADGRDDVVNVESFDGVHYARGAAGTVTSWQGAALSFDSAPAAGDLDGDGIDDVAAADNIGNMIRVYFGGATGVSAACSFATPGGANISGIVIGDVAGRGANELVVFTATTIYVWTVARCSYSGLITSNVSVALSRVELIDIDGDGALDVIGSSNLDWYVAGGVVSGGKPTGKLSAPILIRSGVDSLSFGDTNRDGIGDLFAALSAEDRLAVFVNHRYSPGARWSQALATTSVTGAPRQTDRFGRPWAFPVLARPTVDRDTIPRAARDPRSSFGTRLRRSGLAVPVDARAISLAWQFAGDQVSSSTTDGVDIAVTVRQPLAGHELIVAMSTYDTAPVDPTKMHVYGRVVAEYETDPDGVLQRTPDGASLWKAVENWLEVTRDRDGDLSTGSGTRFVYDSATKRILIASESLGVFRAYATP